jgi:K(+)-stimulated pyrophosphate-energized sodium pump
MTDVNTYLWAVITAGVLALIYAAWKTNWINKQDQGTERMVLIGKSIAEGAMAFLKAEYRVLGIFVVVVALLLGIANAGRTDSSALISLSFIVGAFASGLAGFLGMRVATRANNRTTHAARSSLAAALNVAFTGGSVMGLSVVGLGLIGLGSLFIPYQDEIEVRGELFLSKSTFGRINKTQVSKNLPLFANPRNAAAGTMRQLDSKVAASRNIDG